LEGAIRLIKGFVKLCEIILSLMRGAREVFWLFKTGSVERKLKLFTQLIQGKVLRQQSRNQNPGQRLMVS